MNENEGIIKIILERLDKIESEIVRIKNILPQDTGKYIQTLVKQPFISPESQKEKEQRTAVKIKEGTQKSLENIIGTKWIGRIGMLAIIFALGFFLKYSFENRIIGETGRIILGLISGVFLIGLGEFFQTKKNWDIYGQIYTGGGLAVLYFSVYAAFSFYHLISQPLAFLTLIVITTTGIVLSVRYSAFSIVCIGMLGGFLSPVMLSTGENKLISLFLYILLLDIGIMSVVYFRQWCSVGILSLFGTIFMYIGWHEAFYTTGQFRAAFCVTTVFFFLYNIYVLLPKKKSMSSGLNIIVLSAIAYFFAFLAQNSYESNWSIKIFVLALSCIEIIFAGISLKILNSQKLTTYGFAGVSILFNVISVFVVFEKEWISAALASEMVILCFIGLNLKKLPMRQIAYVLAAICLIRFFEEIDPLRGPFDTFTLILNTRFFICGFIIAGFYTILFLLYKNKDRIFKNEAVVIPIILIISQFMSVVLLSVEFTDYFESIAYKARFISRYAENLSLSVIWSSYAAVLISAGIIRKMKILRILGIMLMCIAIVKVFFFDLSELQTIYRIVSFVILGILLLGISYSYNRYKNYLFGGGING